MLKSILIILLVLLAILALLVIVAGKRMAETENELITQLRKQVPIWPVQDTKQVALPDPVKSYFKYALGNSSFRPRYVKVNQSGFFRFLKEESKFSNEEAWKKMTATQHFIINPLGFYWFAKIKMNGLFWMRGWDSYDAGKGSMRWKANSLITVMNASGERLDEGSLYRYLAESVWFRTALLPENGVSWKVIDDYSAEATLVDGKLSATVIFHFNDQHQIYKMSSQRYMESNGSYIKTGWYGYYRNYQEMNGFNIPLVGEVSWQMPHGEMKYVRLKIDSIVYH